MRMRIPFPGWVAGLSAGAFLATWMLAPGESLSGRIELPASPPPRAPHRSAAQALPPRQAREVPAEPRPLFLLGQPNQIALTFDDGPHHVHTARLLQILAAHQARATFFVNGCWLDPDYQHAWRNREVLRQAFREGHAIGNHTFHHVNLGSLPRDEQTDEVVSNEQLIERVLGVRPYLFRPPYAVLTRHALDLLRQRDYLAVRWNAAVPDEESRQPEEIQRTVLLWLRHHGGGIVMLHDRNRATVEAVELILQALGQENRRRLARGETAFRVVPLDSFPEPTAVSGAREGRPAPSAASDEPG